MMNLHGTRYTHLRSIAANTCLSANHTTLLSVQQTPQNLITKSGRRRVEGANVCASISGHVVVWPYEFVQIRLYTQRHRAEQQLPVLCTTSSLHSDELLMRLQVCSFLCLSFRYPAQLLVQLMIPSRWRAPLSLQLCLLGLLWAPLALASVPAASSWDVVSTPPWCNPDLAKGAQTGHTPCYSPFPAESHKQGRCTAANDHAGWWSESWGDLAN